MRLCYGLVDNDHNSGIGPFTYLKFLNSKMPPQVEVSSINVFFVLRNLENAMRQSLMNCTKEELQAFLEKEIPENYQSLVIKPSDKGGNIVVLDHTQYHRMCDKYTTCYKILSLDLTESYKTELNKLLMRAKSNNLVSSHEFEFLLPRFHRNIL